MIKRYYRKPGAALPEGADRLESAVRLPVTEARIADLLEGDFHGRNMKAAVGYLILKHGLWEQAMNIGLADGRRTAFRATWALEWAYEYGRGELPEWFAGRMADDFAVSGNGSLHRVYAKMLCDMIRFGGFRPSYAQAERMTAKCFDLAIDPKTKGAVQFWCLEMLYELSPRFDRVPEALEDAARRISEDPCCSPGMSAVCRDILERLKQNDKVLP